jgi:hypothetical protein
MKAFDDLAAKAADPERHAKTARELIAAEDAGAWLVAQQRADAFLELGNTRGFENWSAVVREIMRQQSDVNERLA